MRAGFRWKIAYSDENQRTRAITKNNVISRRPAPNVPSIEPGPTGYVGCLFSLTAPCVKPPEQLPYMVSQSAKFPFLYSPTSFAFRLEHSFQTLRKNAICLFISASFSQSIYSKVQYSDSILTCK